MIKQTRWSPDTCACVLTYEWDDGVSEDKRIHTPTTVEFACEAHAKVDNVHDTVLTENVHKNNVIAKVNNLKLGLEEIKYYFDEERQLKLQISDKLDTTALATVDAALEAEFGKGKVTIE